MRFAPTVLFALLVLSVLPGVAQTPSKKEKAKTPPATPAKGDWADWVEPDFPCFSSVLDCRDVGEGFPKDNLTPRGLILNLGHNLWACFDTDLLRIACIWESEPGKPPVSALALAPGSYHIAGQKTKDGQEDLPKPLGKVWLANGIYPGWQVGDKPSFTDPREPAPSKEEVGRGPLPSEQARFVSVQPTKLGALLRYELGGTWVEELLAASRVNDLKVIHQSLRFGTPSPKRTRLIGFPSSDLFAESDLEKMDGCLALKLDTESGSGWKTWHLTLVGKSAVKVAAKEGEHHAFLKKLENFNPAEPWPGLWRDKVVAKASLSTSPEAYVLDSIPLPVPNPWKRNVRLADIAFLNDQGDAAGVTFDGDVWLISGLKGDLENVTWKRFASGLHEPMSIVARQREHPTSNVEHRTSKDQSSTLNVDLFVFDRSGIWKLIDSNNDRECDRYEMFCNLPAQTAETREFPNSMKLGSDGSLYISKGGQEGTTRGKHNGTVIKVAPDGKSFEVIGYGLRQPFIGVHPETGLVTASDQQGHYVPSTPLHIIGGHRFYGHLPTIAEKEKYPEAIADPLTWLPHPVNPSGVTQTWLVGAKMGPINDELIHIGYNRPELFRVLMNSRFKKPQAAVMSFWRDLDFPTLNAHVNPADGQLYVVGFQVWGTIAPKLSGLARLRYTDKPRVLLKELTPTDKGVLLRFNAKLDAKLATDPASYSAERWNYKRTPEYGSPHLKLDGSAGQEFMTASSAYLSEDGQSVLVGFPDMKGGVSQMRLGWGLKSADGLKAENTAYFTPWELASFDSVKEGFGKISVDLTPRAAVAVATMKPTAEEGARLYQMFGCMACHSTDGSTVGKVGPSWSGLFGSEREIAKGMKGKIKADAAYLRESILAPSAKVVKGFEKFDTGMPIYAGILNDAQIDSLILYIQTLK
jgi:mono/diheme cytochrome c family protein